jgi:hypothetical protein
VRIQYSIEGPPLYHRGIVCNFLRQDIPAVKEAVASMIHDLKISAHVEAGIMGSIESLEKLRLSREVPLGYICLMSEGTLSKSTKEFLNKGADTFEGFVPVADVQYSGGGFVTLSFECSGKTSCCFLSGNEDTTWETIDLVVDRLQLRPYVTEKSVRVGTAPPQKPDAEPPKSLSAPVVAAARTKVQKVQSKKPNAFVVLPTNYGYDDFYFYQDEPCCYQPEGIFLERASAEAFLKKRVVPFLKEQDSVTMFFLQAGLEDLDETAQSRVREIFKLSPDAELVPFFVSDDWPGIKSLKAKEIKELVELLGIQPLSIIEMTVDDPKTLASIQSGIEARDPTRRFREQLSDASQIPINEYEPFPDDQ